MRYEELPSHAKEIYYKARQRAGLRRLQFALAREEFAALWTEANGKCAISGIPFELDLLGHRKKRPFAPSLDRIESSAGYVAGNLRLVCVAVNFAMNAWGESVLRRIAEGMFGIRSSGGMDSPPLKGAGATKHGLRDGRFAYASRLTIDGRQYTFGRFSSRLKAADKTRSVREAIEGGADPLSLVTKHSLAKRASLHRNPTRAFSQTSAEAPQAVDAKVVLAA